MKNDEIKKDFLEPYVMAYPIQNLVYQDSKRRAPSPEPQYDGSRPAKHTVPNTETTSRAQPSRKCWKPTKHRWWNIADLTGKFQLVSLEAGFR
jgi:hypothetical protein